MDLLNQFLDWVKTVGVSGFFDILFMSLLIYTFLVWFKRTRAAFVLKGIFIVTVVYLLARQFNLIMMATVLEKFFAVFIIAIIIIFQEELKYFFEQLASWSLNRKFFKTKRKILPKEEVGVLARTLSGLARKKIGALVVVQGKDVIARHLEGGINLNGEISAPLLESIFDPHSAGHDGAVVIAGKTIVKFGCHLPLSKDFDQLKEHGTRHAAALGMAELTDALCLVVSEEHGTISVVRFGNIRRLNDFNQLSDILEQFLRELSPRNQENFWEGFLRKNSKEKLYAVILALMLWFVLVHGSKQTYKSFLIPVTYAALPASWVVQDMEPKEIEIVLKGTRTAFYFIQKDRMKAFLNLKLVRGEQEISIYSHSFLLPKNVVLDSFEPHEVRVLLNQNEEMK